MCVVLYGSRERCRAVAQMMPDRETKSYADTTELIPGLMRDDVEAVFVFMDGADGMEGVMAARKQLPDVPIVWFSKDKNFGAQAWRLKCRYFSLMPITKEKVAEGLRRCRP